MASRYIISTQIQRLKMRIEELPLKSHNIVAHALKGWLVLFLNRFVNQLVVFELWLQAELHVALFASVPFELVLQMDIGFMSQYLKKSE